MKPRMSTVVLAVAIALVGLTGFTSQRNPAPELAAQECGAGDGKLCRQLCVLQCGGACCDWRYYYYTTEPQ